MLIFHICTLCASGFELLLSLFKSACLNRMKNYHFKIILILTRQELPDSSEKVN
jgi:hypothetical protein